MLYTCNSFKKLNARSVAQHAVFFMEPENRKEKNSKLRVGEREGDHGKSTISIAYALA